VINVKPSRTVQEQDRDLGPRLFGRNPDLCCYLRKVEPLNRALEPYLAWISGIRRDEATSRTGTKVVEWDAKRQMVKVNPIAKWTQEDVDNYMSDNGVLINPLHYDNYPSIGCAPCTRQVAEGEDPRSGRWAGLGKVECGIHL
jgi:phosphoadenosine phosphosulfate reductase